MDRNANGGGIALYIREDIPSRQSRLKAMIKMKNTFFLKSASQKNG